MNVIWSVNSFIQIKNLLRNENNYLEESDANNRCRLLGSNLPKITNVYAKVYFKKIFDIYFPSHVGRKKKHDRFNVEARARALEP